MHRLPPVLTHTLQPAQQSQRHSCRHLPTSSITATACSSRFPAVCELWTCERVHAHKTTGQVFRGVVEEGLRPPVPADCTARYASLMQSCWEAEPHNRCGGGVKSVCKCGGGGCATLVQSCWEAEQHNRCTKGVFVCEGGVVVVCACGNPHTQVLSARCPPSVAPSMLQCSSPPTRMCCMLRVLCRPPFSLIVRELRDQLKEIRLHERRRGVGPGAGSGGTAWASSQVLGCCRTGGRGMRAAHQEGHEVGISCWQGHAEGL